MFMAAPDTSSSELAKLPASVCARLFVVIPAYDEATVIADVVGRVVRQFPNVIVVDDGSTDATAALAAKAGALVVRHVLNRGQGAALQTGIICALERNAEYIVTFDSDGQHLPEDIHAVAAPVVSGDYDIVLGSRFLGSAEGIGSIRKRVLRAAVAFTRVTSGVQVSDTHNGLRCFSRRAAEKIDIRLDRMAHASELMDQIRGMGLPITEVPVHIRYTDYSRKKGQRSTNAVRILFDYLIGKWMR